MQTFRWTAIVAAILSLVVFSLAASGPAMAQENDKSPPSTAMPVKEFTAPDYTNVTRSVEGARLPLEKPVVLWKYLSDVEALPDGTTKMVSVTSPVVADGVVYFGNDTGRLSALNAADGAVIWTHEHGVRLAWQPSLDKEYVYIGTERGISAIRRADGALVWCHNVEHGATDASPIPVGDRVYAAGYDGQIYALHCKSGKVAWKHDFGKDAPPDQPGFEGKRARFQEIVARPGGAACDGGILVQCVFDQSRVIALDCATGKRLWTFQAAGWMSAAPTIVKDRIILVSQDAHVYCLHRDTGEVVWKFKTTGWFSTPVAVHAGQVFVTHHRGRLYQLDAESGRQLKLFQPMDEVEGKALHGSAPLVANGIAYYTTSKGRLYAVDIEGGGVRWQLNPSEDSSMHTNLTTDGSRIFARTDQSLEKKGESAILAIGSKAP